MKRNQSGIFAAFFAALIAVSNVNGQTSVNLDLQQVQKRIFEIVKERELVKGPGAESERINPKAVKDFARRYKSAVDENWVKVEDGFRVKFTSKGAWSSVFYDNNGKWFGSIKSYDGAGLPNQISSIVKSQYQDYSITHVDEMQTVDSQGVFTYLIHLENKAFVKLIRYYDGQIVQWDSFEKI